MNFTKLIPSFEKWRAGPGKHSNPSNHMSEEVLEEYLSWYYSEMQSLICEYWEELEKIMVYTER